VYLSTRIYADVEPEDPNINAVKKNKKDKKKKGPAADIEPKDPNDNVDKKNKKEWGPTADIEPEEPEAKDGKKNKRKKKKKGDPATPNTLQTSGVPTLSVFAA
jgi:hypothetical protein